MLIGSRRAGRQSHKIGYYLEKQMLHRGLLTEMIDLGLREGVHGMNASVSEADGVILITPEYHGSFSGVLKTALDALEKELYHKPVGIVTVSSGRMGGVLASAQLQNVVLHLGGYVLPNKLLVPDVNTAFNDAMELVNERTLKSAAKFLDEYLWLSEAIHDKKAKAATACKIIKAANPIYLNHKP